MAGKKTMGSKSGFIGKRAYGWVPDVPDQRDYLLSAVLKAPARLPAKVDLRSLCSKVEDQGQLGSCTANALAGAIEFLERRDQVPFTDFNSRTKSVKSARVPSDLLPPSQPIPHPISVDLT